MTAQVGVGCKGHKGRSKREEFGGGVTVVHVVGLVV